MNVKPSVMERVARCTQAEVVSSIDAQLTRPTLGMCHNFYLRLYPLSGPNRSKTLMFFDGCATHLGCTVILRGASNAELKRVKKIMQFMIYAAYNWKLERTFLIDEYTYIAPLPSESFDLEDQVFEDCDSGVGKIQSVEEDSNVPKNATQVVLNLDDTCANNNDSWSHPQLMDVSRDENVQRDLENSSSGVPVPTAGALDRAKLSQTVSDFSDPLHSYLNSGASPQESPLEPSQESFSLTEQPLANSFRKAVDDTILSCSPYLRYSVPHLESEAGQNCFLRKYFQKNLYFSVQFEKDNLMRRPKFSEMEPKHSRNSHKNIEIQDLHYLIKLKITNELHDKDFQAVLTDFRARGGQMRNICKCEDSSTSDTLHNEYQHISVEKPSNGVVIVEGLPAMISGKLYNVILGHIDLIDIIALNRYHCMRHSLS